MTRHLPVRTETERQGYYGPPTQARPVQARPVQPYREYPPDPYPPTMYYSEPKPDRTPIWIAAIVSAVVVLIILALMFVYITTPPAPIVHHSNPSCLFWCN